MLDFNSDPSQIAAIAWLVPPNIDPQAKTALNDLKKRWEIFSELIYYVFDSFLMPLIRSNFHVTESNIDRNRIFFFRHDVWRSLTDSALQTLKESTFDTLDTRQAQEMLRRRRLGFSHIRLLPKAIGLRPIMNLRRRVMTTESGHKTLAPSINSVLAPVFSVLSYEKVGLGLSSP